MSETRERENQVAAALCHASAILFFAGMLVPLVTLLTTKDTEAKLRRQAKQALLYQGIASAAYLIISVILFGVYMAVMLGMALFSIDLSASAEASALWMVLMGIFFIIMMFFGFLMQVLGPLYLGFALFAGLRSLQGRDFNYPLLGRLVKPASA
jgi:uncharacterized Tic20 family protein